MKTQFTSKARLQNLSLVAVFALAIISFLSFDMVRSGIGFSEVAEPSTCESALTVSHHNGTNYLLSVNVAAPKYEFFETEEAVMLQPWMSEPDSWNKPVSEEAAPELKDWMFSADWIPAIETVYVQEWMSDISSWCTSQTGMADSMCALLK
jgi:hypothetical protein